MIVVVSVLFVFMAAGLLRRNDSALSVTVDVLPRDARLYINGRASGGGVVKLVPGDYVFTAKKDGFDDAIEKTTISASRTYVALLPAPVSKEALDWAEKNNSERERLAGNNAVNRGEGYREANPIISLLPQYDIAGPYTIDYGFKDESTDKTYLLIGNSTPEGRKKALQWIRDAGYNPSELDIRFADFTNPTTGGAQ